MICRNCVSIILLDVNIFKTSFKSKNPHNSCSLRVYILLGDRHHKNKHNNILQSRESENNFGKNNSEQNGGNPAGCIVTDV